MGYRGPALCWPLRVRGATLRGVPGQLPRPVIPSLAALDAFLAATLPSPPAARPFRILSRVYLALQAFFLLVVRLADGSEAFLEGAVARGLGVMLLLQALPIALGVARGGGDAPDEGAVALAGLRGYPRAAVLGRAIYAPLRAVGVAMAPALIALGLWPLFLSIDDEPLRLLQRIGLTALLCVAAMMAAAALVLLGVLVGRRVPGPRAPWALLALLVVPWVGAWALDLPREASLPGLYRSLIERLLGLAP